MAYCSYSGFPVGAAVLTTGGQHDSTAFYLGRRRKYIQYVKESFHLTNSDIKDSFVGPCGACRQVLMEFGTEWDIYLTKPDGIIGRPVSESSSASEGHFSHNIISVPTREHYTLCSLQKT
uniref:Zgc:103586 n=2 Tax=Sinocyclocheilus rhinocerous TaxID=307959 RepID=A0A673M2Z8_9TELE